MKKLIIEGTTPMCLDTETGEKRLWKEGELEEYFKRQEALIEENEKSIKPFHVTPGMTCEEALKGCGGVTLEEFRQIGLREIRKLYGKEEDKSDK